MFFVVFVWWGMIYYSFLPLHISAGFKPPGEGGSIPECLARAFATLKLFCLANKLNVYGIKNFTTQNMHAGKNAFPWLGCKGSDSIVILKFLRFYAALILREDGWSAQEQQLLKWMIGGAEAGLSFSQGIHGHGIWLTRSCVLHLRRCVQRFGNFYACLANYSLQHRYSLYAMVPKLHAYLHFRADFDDFLHGGREVCLNPACFDNSMSEDFIGRVARQSRRISFKKIEWTILRSYQVKTKFVIDKFTKLRRNG